MIYKYNRKSLVFERFKIKNMLAVMIGVPALFFIIGFYKGRNISIKEIPIESMYHLIQESEQESFSEENLANMLKELNVRFPHIVMAQAMIESGHFQSNIFRANHNLFGMKQARARCTTAKGTELNHAYYDNWRESVYDYAFFQSRYLNDLRTETQYLEYLDRNYAEAENYDKAILKVVADKKLREMFSK